MALYGNLRDYKFSEEVDDIRGSDIYSTLDNEKLGKIDDVIFEPGSGDVRYLVVDTGGWLSSNKFLVPARQISVQADNDANDHYYIAMSRQQIERLPAYDEKKLERDEEFSDYEKKYHSAWTTDGDVLHKEGSTHIITPETGEVSGSGSAGSSAGNIDVSGPRRIAREEPVFGATSRSDSTGTGRLVEEDDRVADIARRPGSTLESATEGIERERTPRAQPIGSRSQNIQAQNREARHIDDTIAGENAAGSDARNADPAYRSRFDRFQQRLRNDREAIIRSRSDRDRAA